MWRASIAHAVMTVRSSRLWGGRRATGSDRTGCNEREMSDRTAATDACCGDAAAAVRA